MANDETKSVTTSHEEEQMIIEKHEQFGWSLHTDGEHGTEESERL